MILLFLFVVFQKICKLLNWTKGGDEYSKAEETLTLIWEGLKKYADENQVSLHNYQERQQEKFGDTKGVIKSR
jgi:hypothetical protein